MIILFYSYSSTVIYTSFKMLLEYFGFKLIVRLFIPYCKDLQLRCSSKIETLCSRWRDEQSWIGVINNDINIVLTSVRCAGVRRWLRRKRTLPRPHDTAQCRQQTISALTHTHRTSVNQYPTMHTAPQIYRSLWHDTFYRFYYGVVMIVVTYSLINS